MMNFFIRLIGMSLQASIVIGVVLLLRFFFQKINVSKKYVMLLWMIPFICLIFPWKINSPIGFWNSAPSEYEYENVVKTEGGITDYVNQMTGQNWSEGADIPNGVNGTNIGRDDENTSNMSGDITNGADANGNVSDDVHSGNSTNVSGTVSSAGNADTPGTSSTTGSQNAVVIAVLAILWMTVLAALSLYSILTFIHLKKQLCKCIPIRDHVFFVDHIDVPMVVGMVNPKIYIPSGIEREHMEYVIAHEETHIRRKDTVVKMSAYCITCLHWFNPLVWLSYNLMVKDMEMACDEETILRLGQEKKKDYATALLQLATGKRNVFAVPLAFGEGSTKARIKNILKYKKTKQILAVAALAIGVLVAVIFLTKDTPGTADPVGGTEDSEISDGDTEEESEDMEKTTELTTQRGEDTGSSETGAFRELADIGHWMERKILSKDADISVWYKAYNGETLYRITEDGTYGPATRPDIIYYKAKEGEDLQTVLNTMIDSMMIPLMEDSDARAYTIVRYALEEHPVIQVGENAWIIRYINGYYEYTGVDLIDMETALMDGPVREDGMVPFLRQGSEDVFAYILIEENGVYRLQRAGDMRSGVRVIFTEQSDETKLSAETLEWMENYFFNNPDNYMPNQFLSSEYDSPAEIDIGELFYNGRWDIIKREVSQEEIQLLKQRYNAMTELDESKSTVEDMNAVLQKYMGITLEETRKNGIDSLYYLEEYDAYYNVAGDTNLGRFDLESGWINADGTMTIQYSPVEGFGMHEYVYQVTLKEVYGNYYFISNIRVK